MTDGVDRDSFGVGEGAEKLALAKVLQSLVQHASETKPDFRDDVLAAVDAYLSRLDPRSDLEQDFARRAKECLRVYIQPPTQR